MTREEAIKIIEDARAIILANEEAMRMATEALKAEPNSCEYWDSESHFCALRRPQAEPTTHEWEWCHDCKEYDHEEHCCHRWTKVIRNTVEELRTDYKPVKHGHWEGDGQCSVCKEYPLARYMRNPTYCPNCGAKMDGEREDEVENGTDR